MLMLSHSSCVSCSSCFFSIISDSRQTEDMDISPGSTPSNSRPNSRPASRLGTPVGSGGSGHLASTPSSMPVGTPMMSVSGGVGGPRSSGVNSVGMLPQLISQLGDKSLQKINSQELTQQGNERKNTIAWKFVFIVIIDYVQLREIVLKF